MANAVKLHNVTVRFTTPRQDSFTAVNKVSLTVEQGDIFGIVGYSDAGKSTLVRTINLLQRPSSGTMQVGNTILYHDQRQLISAAALRQKRRRICRGPVGG
ncbi:ATP-binding cassette domain-containing protein [Ligilactobacillus hohenheimensis]|uniref:ATP-binding cassette domain-containing protein n=1 Tax=Ligilactobacillus hohenheimensis TaxID=2991832 RepID=UPI0024BAE90E|nr:ATP-binding cassette domain-containing protein [Ligilactobacillus hohenheimensis]